IQSAACRTDMPISLIWNRAIKDADYLELKSHERQILIDMGASLGRFEADEQGSVIMHARRAIDNCLKAAEADKLRMGKLYGSLGVVCGLAVVIMLL
ncbi:MAG: stage III sporulation protein AB, partial [Clostridia bacterium]